jgi:pimeloyl-ACP methyl ester carboxylesterase
VASLVARGHDALAPDLPFHDPSASFAARLRPALLAIDSAADLVVVGHSMAHSYAPFVAATQPAALLVHLCPGVGPLRHGFPWPASRPDGTSVWDPSAAIEAMYPRLQPEIARALARRLRPMAPAPDQPDANHAPVATVVICAAEDELFDPASERSIARETLGIEPVEIPGGHFPMAEDPHALADLLDRQAREHTTTTKQEHASSRSPRG